MVSLKPSSNSNGKDGNEEKPEKATIQYLMETLQNLQRENDALKLDISKSKKIPSGRVGFILLGIGALALVAAIVATSSVLAFIGLGLTFWGFLFLFARPMKFVKSYIMDSTVISSYTTIDRMIQDLDYKGKPIYIPPYPREAYLPEYLKGLREMTVFIPAEDIKAIPTIEEMARKQFLLKNPKGICIAPPGSGLVSLFEKEFGAEFSQADLERLLGSLPSIVGTLELANQFEIRQENNLVYVKVVDSIYKDLYSREQNLKSVLSIGCPLTSAIACVLAKTTAKTVNIVKSVVSLDLHEIEVWYQPLEAD